MTAHALLATEASPALPQVDSLGGFVVAMAMVLLVYGGWKAILAMVQDHRRERRIDAMDIADQATKLSYAQVEKLMQQNDALADKLERLERKNDKLEERVTALERSNHELARQIDVYRNLVKALRGHIDNLVVFINKKLPGDDTYPKLVEHNLIDVEV